MTGKTSSDSGLAKDSAKAKITAHTNIGELVAKHPEAAGVLMQYGFHCIGCHMAAHETIEQGASSHGIDKKSLEKMLAEMNKLAK